jgi:hypothetical protein
VHSYFDILLRGILGVVKKSGSGSSIFVFYCIFMIQFFAPPPSSLLPPVCIYDTKKVFIDKADIFHEQNMLKAFFYNLIMF